MIGQRKNSLHKSWISSYVGSVPTFLLFAQTNSPSGERALKFVPIISDLTGVEPVDIDVCSSALSLITRLVADNHELNRKLCKPMGFLRKLMKLCSPFEDNGMTLYIQVTYNYQYFTLI